MRPYNDAKRCRECANVGASGLFDSDSEIEVLNIEAENKRVFAKQHRLNSDFLRALSSDRK